MQYVFLYAASGILDIKPQCIGRWAYKNGKDSQSDKHDRIIFLWYVSNNKKYQGLYTNSFSYHSNISTFISPCIRSDTVMCGTELLFYALFYSYTWIKHFLWLYARFYSFFQEKNTKKKYLIPIISKYPRRIIQNFSSIHPSFSSTYSTLIYMFYFPREESRNETVGEALQS